MSLLGKIFKRPIPTKLGRWATGETMDIIVRKAELATDDHCGSDLCTRNNTDKKEKRDKPNKNKQNFAYDMDPLLPYII